MTDGHSVEFWRDAMRKVERGGRVSNRYGQHRVGVVVSDKVSMVIQVDGQDRNVPAFKVRWGDGETKVVPLANLIPS